MDQNSGVFIFFSLREIELQWEEESTEQTDSYLGLNACPGGGSRSTKFCVGSGMDLLLP